jgi:hypothetical protein
MNFDDVWELLDSTVPPEVTHYREGSHPGMGWWLKTVIPSDQTCSVTKAWQTLAEKNQNMITLVEVAYNWHGQIINGATSIWLRNQQDVDLDMIQGQWHYVIRPYDESVNVWGHRLADSIKIWHKFNKTSASSNHGWHKLKDVAKLLQNWTSNQQAQIKRKGFKLVVNNQKDSSHSAH